MKREYASMVRNNDGTYSGKASVTRIERLTIFKEACFTITGYHDTKEEELVELLFLLYASSEGIVIRRIFEGCVFSFVDFTRDQIDDVMYKLGKRKRSSQVRYAFTDCRVLSDGVEIQDYPMPTRDATTDLILRDLPKQARVMATLLNVRIDYNLELMTYYSPREKSSFFADYTRVMTMKRDIRAKKQRCGEDENDSLCLTV